LASRRGRLFVIAGPSGVGKGSVVKELLARDPGLLALSISATTRPPRAAEVHGRDYFFVSTDQFEQMVDEGAMLEWASVFDHFYGTPADAVAAQLDSGRDVILEIDVQGARQVHEKVPGAVLILLAPPSMEELGRRLRGRGTESEEKIARRLDEAERELATASWFDHLIVNEDLERTVSEVAVIIEEAGSASANHREDPSS
jgi:guanylate kinase